MGVLSLVVVFSLSGAAVIAAGTVLARLADELSEATGLGRVWTGAVVLAGATSLPELLTDVSAVRIGAPDIAAGDLFGSSLANMLILGIAGLASSVRPAEAECRSSLVPTASLAVLLNGLAGLFILAPLGPRAAGVGAESVILFGAYALGMRALYRSSRAARLEAGRKSVRGPLKGIAGAAVVIVLAAPAFAWSARGLAEATGLGETFVGTWLVGLATSLPELVSSLQAARMGAFDLAAANLFGSNALNMAIFLPLDAAHRGGPLFAALAPAHALTALAAVVLMGLGLADATRRPGRRWDLTEPSGLLLIVAYCAALVLLFRATR